VNTIATRNDGDISFSLQHTSAFDFRNSSPAKFVRGRASYPHCYISRARVCTTNEPDTDCPPEWYGPCQATIRAILRAHPRPRRGNTIDENGKPV
jgi:hypothetical protein